MGVNNASGGNMPGVGRKRDATRRPAGQEQREPNTGGHAAMWFGHPAVDFPTGRRSVHGDEKVGNGHSVWWDADPANDFELGAFPDGGGYPKGFLRWAYRTLTRDAGHPVDPARVLHLCSGSVRVGVRVDIRPEMEPDIVADVRAVPLPDDSFDWIMADPPYTLEYAANLYGTAKDYPKPQQILREGARLLRPGGRIGVLHFQVPMIPKGSGLRIVQVYGITTGSGYAIRAWSVFEKADAGMGL